ncbi:FAD binding domain-containing protein [Pseudonocardia bannensis]|uniref:Quinaldine-4-oxidase, medium subunit MeqB n=1 Tax=Pseudonocardia bannensis TaxID=630973 RepID=A0A848DES3_9PSEU|nr:FAD binding domain-containing protein [Pseudonocardia bannensis]NMH91063.1 quinaldine-4-oxidase, medium subunit MeqB [Pseudonocardia bannensis]
MKPFSFHSPRGLGEAVDLLERHGPGAQVIAGGQTLLLAMKERLARPSALVSLAEVADLRGWRYTDSGALEIGAATTYAALAEAELTGVPLRGWHTEIAAVAGDLADRPVRTMGTIGGALCAADPRFDMVTLVVALDAELDTVGAGGGRTIRAAEFFDPVGGTVLRPGEILTTVRFRPQDGFSGVAFEKFRYRVFDAALVSAVCALRLGADGAVADARVTVGAVHPAPVLATTAADRLVGGTPTAVDTVEIGLVAADEVLPAEQATTSVRRYQRELIGVLVGRAIARSHERAHTTTAGS